MNRQGFSLLTVLWTVTLLSVVSGAVLAGARIGSAATRNRLYLTRSGWAREACLEILKGDYAERQELPAPDDSISLGRDTWCRVTVEDPGALLHLNRASPSQLRALMGVDSVVAAVLDWRDDDHDARNHGAEDDWYRARGRRQARDSGFADPSELAYVKGVLGEDYRRLIPLVTVRGTGAINLNSAPRSVLQTIPQLSGEAINRLLFRRESAQPITTAEHLAAILSPNARQRLLKDYAGFLSRVSFKPQVLVAHVEGWVSRSPVRARMVVTLVPIGQRLAVVRREVS